MKHRAAWVVLTCVVATSAAVQVIAVRSGQGVDVAALAFLAFPVVGALIASRQPGNAIGTILLGIGAGMFVSDALAIYIHFGRTVSPGLLPGTDVAVALWVPLWVPFIGFPGTFLLLLFPDGRLPSPGWRPWALFCGAAMVVTYLVLLVLPADFADFGYPGVENPLRLDLGPLGTALTSIVALIPISIAGCALGLIRRFRRARGLERVQMKWLAAAAAAVALAYFMLMALNLPSLVTEGDPPAWVEGADVLPIVAFGLIPTAIGMSVLRYRLYDIDVVINRTLVYGALTVVLTVVYVAGVVGLGGLVRAGTGRADNSLVIAATTLAVAALFRPARARIQAFIDRHFYRSRYDAVRTLESFSSRLRDEVDLDALTDDLAGLVGETMHPSHVSLWLRDPARPN